MNHTHSSHSFVTLLLSSLAAACSSDGDLDTNGSNDTDSALDCLTPTVIGMSPALGASAVALNAGATVTFSQAMDADTLNVGTFTLTYADSAVAVPGSVIYSDAVASFWPTAHLSSNTGYRATVSTDVRSACGAPLAGEESWDFTTGTMLMPGLPVNLGTANGFAILAKSGVSTVPTSAVTGDVGVSPVAATYITGFSLTSDATNVFATSPQVTGKVYAADYASPTPTNLTAAVSDMELAFTDAAGRAPDATELGAGILSGQTLVPGVYKWGTGLFIPTDLTLDGSATDVWIFQIAQDLTMSSGTHVILTGGALPENVFWQVSGAVDLGTTAHGEGTYLAQTAITLRTGASIHGRLLAQTAVDIDGSTLVEPAH